VASTDSATCDENIEILSGFLNKIIVTNVVNLFVGV
jgi:hypothetical protein